MDTLFRRGSSAADSNCPKMGLSQRRVEEGDGVGFIITNKNRLSFKLHKR